MTAANLPLDVYSRKEAVCDFAKSFMYGTVGSVIMGIGYTILVCSFSAFWRATNKPPLQDRIFQWIRDILTPVQYCVVTFFAMFCQLVSIFIYPLSKETMDEFKETTQNLLKTLDNRFIQLETNSSTDT